MPSFVYKAKKDNAETVTGQLTANNQDEAIDLISQLGLLPVEITESDQQEVSLLSSAVKRVSHKELYRFTKQLASLLKSGLSLIHALNVIEQQMGQGSLKTIIQDVSLGVRHGRSLSDMLHTYPHIFSTLYVAMVRAGEESGRLREMLVSIAEYQKSQDEIIRQVKTAMVYPAVMLLVGIATIIFILSFVMPRVSTLFQGAQVDLPWPTIIVMAISEFVQHSWYALLIVAFFLTVGLRFLKKSQAVRSALHTTALNLPFFGDLILKIEIERFTRTLALLLSSGVSILRSIQIAVPTLSNDVIREELLPCGKFLQGGGSLGIFLRQSTRMPDLVGQLISIGEESGTLNDALSDISESYTQDINETTKVMTTLIEPILILAIGLTIGFVVFAMLLPIFQMDILAR